MSWWQHLSFKKQFHPSLFPSEFHCVTTSLAHHSKQSFFFSLHISCLLITSNKSKFYSLSGSSRAYHSLINYLCLLPPSIGPSCHLSSNTRSIFKHLLLFPLRCSSKMWTCSKLSHWPFKSFSSNPLCLQTEMKLGCLGSSGCAELMLHEKLLCLPVLSLLYPPPWLTGGLLPWSHWAIWHRDNFSSVFSCEFLSYNWKVLLTDESAVNCWPLCSRKE